MGIAAVVALLFAGSFIAAEVALRELSPIVATWLRFSVAAVVLLLFSITKRATLRVTGPDLFLLILAGISGFAGYNYFFFSAVQHTTLGNTAIINGASPVVTGLLAAFFLRERLSRTAYVGVFSATVGVAVLILGSGRSLTGPSRGDLLMLVAVLCWSVYSLLIKKLSARYSPISISVHASWAGAAFLTLLSLPRMGPELRSTSSDTWLAVLYMGAGASGLGYWLYNLSVLRNGPTRTTSFVYGLVPIFVALLAWFVFEQPVTFIMALATALILFGLRLIRSADRRK